MVVQVLLFEYYLRSKSILLFTNQFAKVVMMNILLIGFILVLFDWLDVGSLVGLWLIEIAMIFCVYFVLAVFANLKLFRRLVKL